MTEPQRPKEYIYFKDLVDEKMNKIILQVLRDIFNKDKTRTPDELAQDPTNPHVDAL